MGIKINISDSNISGNVLNNASIKSNDDVNIELAKLTVNKDGTLLNDLQIESIMQELSKDVEVMDKNSVEYLEVARLLESKNSDCNSTSKRIFKHIAEFSEGVLASIVANYLS